MKIQFYNCPEPAEFNREIIKIEPNFLSYQPDFVIINKLAQKYKEVANVIVIGHGGSITTFAGIASALESSLTKKVWLLSTVDPDRITKIKQATSPDNSLVIAISKSGQTVTQLEALAQFLDYPLIAITGPAGPLADIAQHKQADVVIHPPIGGRFTGLTEVALLPAIICGLDGRQILEGGQSLFKEFSQQNLAFDAASVLYNLEQQGIVDVFMPIYSSELEPFSNLIVQLCHESFGKEGKGQTYFAHEAPESQHHTNQRFFGGRKNIAGWFISEPALNSELKTEFPQALQNIALRDHHLGDLNGISLNRVLNFEKQGTVDDAKINGLPVIDMELGQRSEKEIGAFIAFWQMYAVYSSWLRQVDPFNQPQVENSKLISFAKRMEENGKI